MLYVGLWGVVRLPDVPVEGALPPHLPPHLTPPIPHYIGENEWGERGCDRPLPPPVLLHPSHPPLYER